MCLNISLECFFVKKKTSRETVLNIGKIEFGGGYVNLVNGQRAST